MDDESDHLMNGTCCALDEGRYPLLVDRYRTEARKRDTSRKWMLKMAKETN